MIKSLLKNILDKAFAYADSAEQNAKDYADTLMDSAYEVHITQIFLPSTVSASAGGKATLLSNVDIRTCTYSALEDISGITKTLVGIVFLWTNGASGIPMDILVSDGKASITCYYPTGGTSSAVRLLTFWK